MNKKPAGSLEGVSFKERMEQDLKSRIDREKSLQEKQSRENLRKAMVPNTGRNPIYRKVHGADRRKRPTFTRSCTRLRRCSRRSSS